MSTQRIVVNPLARPDNERLASIEVKLDMLNERVIDWLKNHDKRLADIEGAVNQHRGAMIVLSSVGAVIGTLFGGLIVKFM